MIVDEDRMENAAKWIRRQWGKVQVNSAVQRSFAIRFDAVCIEDYVVRLAVCHESSTTVGSSFDLSGERRDYSSTA